MKEIALIMRWGEKWVGLAEEESEGSYRWVLAVGVRGSERDGGKMERKT